MEFSAAFPADGETLEVVEEHEGLLDDVAELAHSFDVRSSGDDFERGAASVADQVVFAARLPPVDRRRTGVGAPFSARMWEPSTHTRDQSSSPAAFSSASRTRCSRRSKIPATAPAVASTSAPSRTPVPEPGVARTYRCRGRTGCLAGRADPTPASAPETAPATAAATARPTPTTHRPRSTVEHPHPHEQPNRHTGYAPPAHFSMIVLRALRAEMAQGADYGRAAGGTSASTTSDTPATPSRHDRARRSRTRWCAPASRGRRRP